MTGLFRFVGQRLHVYVGHLPEAAGMAQTAAHLREPGKNGYFLLHHVVVILPAGVTGLVRRKRMPPVPSCRARYPAMCCTSG